ncbi:MFS general substrate transporter [Panus rudis PR-1116 ss-1]|nr:MFS general substrate transporter [Panus rudis PR-1116 ss-1]
MSRNTSVVSAGYIPAPESIALPEGAVDEEVAEALHELIHPRHHDNEETRIDDGSGDDEQSQASARSTLPWYKRPSPWWFLSLVPFTAIAMSASLAPRIEIYTKLACEVHRPEYSVGQGNTSASWINEFITATILDGKEDKRCASDPVVQAAVAKLNMVITTGMGILSCCTTGWWSSLSDRRGRIWLLTIGSLGLLYTDFHFILVSKFSKYLPGGYWFYIIGALVDGAVGGVAAVSAALHAYIADCAEPHTRAHLFSLFVGLLFLGMAFGPTLGGLLVKYTENLLSVFYVGTVIHFVYAFMIAFIIPESLTPERMEESRRKHEEQVASAEGRKSWLRTIFGFLTPLSVLLMTEDEGPNGSSDVNPLKRKRDWSLVYLAASYGFSMLLIGSYSYKFQYTSAVFGWTSEQIGYWLSIVGFTRALYLAIVLPAILHLIKPRPPAIQLPIEPNEPLQLSPSTPSRPSRPSTPSPPAQPATTALDRKFKAKILYFDLNLARISLLIEMISFALMPFAPNAAVFTVYTMMTCFGSGFSPAIQSVAMSLYAEKGGQESGKLFGALSIIQSLGTGAVGPALFGLTYMKTVATLPSAIFFLSTFVVALALIFALSVRVPKSLRDAPADDVEDALPDFQAAGAGEAPIPLIREETLVDVAPQAVEGDDGQAGKKGASPAPSV